MVDATVMLVGHVTAPRECLLFVALVGVGWYLSWRRVLVLGFGLRLRRTNALGSRFWGCLGRPRARFRSV